MNLYLDTDSGDRRLDKFGCPGPSALEEKMKKHICLVLLVVFALSLSTIPLWAQATGAVKGVVKDPSGKPIEGATIELTSGESGKKYDLKTNSKGEYSSIGIIAGTYDFTLIKDGQPIEQGRYRCRCPREKKRELLTSISKQAPGMTEEQKKQVEAAQKHNEKVKTLNASLTQAKSLEAAGNWDEAVNVLQQATQVDPNQDLVWFSLGDAQRGAKKYPEAIESYQKAIALKDASPDKAHLGAYHNNLADAYAKSGQTEKAISRNTMPPLPPSRLTQPLTTSTKGPYSPTRTSRMKP